MCDALSVAKTLYNMFLLRNGVELNEASMQKFMYLVQRESLLVNRHVLFSQLPTTLKGRGLQLAQEVQT